MTSRSPPATARASKGTSSTVTTAAADLSASYVRLFAKTGTEKRRIAYADIAGLAFTGKDTAAGKSFETWVKKYRERKAAGETNIGLHPERLD